jgi:hypothetical protein
MKLFISLLCGSILSISCHARDESARPAQIFLQRIVAVDGEATYPDPLIPNSKESGGRIPGSLGDAANRLAGMMPTRFTASSKAQAAEVCRFGSSEQWEHDFVKCGEVVCAALPSRSKDLGCGYLVRVNEWVEEHWLGGLCRIIATDRNKSPLFRWFSEQKLTQCYQMSEVITAAFYRSAAGLPVSESILIESVR